MMGMRSWNSKGCQTRVKWFKSTETKRECNCGANSLSCSYRRNGTRICKCDFGYIHTNGYCSAICSEGTCVHGNCEVIGNRFKCRCSEGYTGHRCEENIENKYNKQELWQILQVSLMFAIFILLSGVLCFISCKRKSKK
ncbi:hypothetical protein AVEN_220444-1 [Araneus ventricosus]|uniref:EGF-like domain-containing protein n=1 Tax=Araneus ventricosus TaxID=182803 RepID=A0A4Y2IQE5_ARAVE|nr:hypothetical protein AVEN_220444-1 [Araneus ventricosus]